MKWLPRLFAPARTLTDEQAMLEVQASGDHDAFAVLVERWQPPIHRLCIRMTGDEHRGEDLAQEAFARVFSSRHQYTPGRRFSTWLWRIALNLCFAEGRRSLRRREPALEAGVELASASHQAEGPEDQVIRAEQAELVRTALASIPETYRSVVILREYENLKYREIAEILELPEGTVKWRMAEALSQLAELLRPQAGEPPDAEGPIQLPKPIIAR
jgi:RNA polymerase sigma-70 factor (ECF subfamily)